jgi:hypothetical protein
MSEIQIEIAAMFNVQSLVSHSQKFYNGALCCNRIYNRVVSVNACNLGILEASECEAAGTWSKPTDVSIGESNDII